MKNLFVILVMLVAMNANAQWVQMSNGMGTDKKVFSLAAKDNLIFAGTNTNGIYISSNNGLSWYQSSLGNISVNAIHVEGSDIYVGTSYTGVYRSNDNGTNWIQTSLNASTVYSLASNTYYVFAGYDSGICKTTNKGETWTYNDKPSTRSFLANGNYVLAGTMGGVYISTNYGQSFSYGTMSSNFFLSLSFHNNIIFGGLAYYGIYKSTDNGMNWSATTLDTVTNRTFAKYNNNLLAGCGSGVYLTNNNGVNWVQKNEGMSGNYWVSSMIISNGFIYAGTPYQGLWRRPLSDITSINEITGVVSVSYSLSQNYPNPFNPVTKIKFDVPSVKQASLFVNLKVFDITSREIQTLVNESLKPGTYEATFDGSKLNSGVYFYKMTAGNYSETRKMLMIK